MAFVFEDEIVQPKAVQAGGRFVFDDTPEEHPISSYGGGDLTSEERFKAMNPDYKSAAPEWAGRNPNLYGAYGAAKETLKTVGRPLVQGLGLAGGALAGSPLGPVGMAGGAGLGYAGANRLIKAAEIYSGATPVETLPEALKTTGKDIIEGAAMEAGGQVIGKAIPPVAGYVGEKAQRLAKRTYQSAAKFPTTLPHAERAKIAETALREKIMPTEKGLGKLAQTQRDILDSVNQAVESVSNKGGKIDTNKVLKQLDYAYEKARLSDDPVGYTKVIDDIAEKFKAHGDTISVSDAHQIKKNIYKLLPSKAYEPTFAASERVSITGRKGLGRGLKEGVEQAVPGVKEANARAKELIDLSEVLNKTVNRIENSNLVSLNTDLAAVVGAQLSGAGGAATLGAARGVLGLPRVKARIAMVLYRSGGQLKNIAEVFGETPAGKQMIDNFKDSKTQAVLKSGISDKDKERFLIKHFESTPVNKPLTWTEFLKGKMGPAMKEHGSHGAAVRELSKQYKTYKKNFK